MIRYALRCSEGHAFESWFHSAGAYDTLAGRGLVSCPDCGSTDVTKALMAPGVASGAAASDAAAPVAKSAPGGGAAVPDDGLPPALAALARLRRKVEESSDWVGRRFATEARAIHDGEAPDRPIWGEATPDEARALAEDGLPIAPLPFGPRRKSN